MNLFYMILIDKLEIKLKRAKENLDIMVLEDLVRFMKNRIL